MCWIGWEFLKMFKQYDMRVFNSPYTQHGLWIGFFEFTIVFEKQYVLWLIVDYFTDTRNNGKTCYQESNWILQVFIFWVPWFAIHYLQVWGTFILVLLTLWQYSDQDRISPYNINAISTTKVMRIKKNVNLGIISWFNTKFSEITW